MVCGHVALNLLVCPCLLVCFSGWLSTPRPRRSILISTNQQSVLHHRRALAGLGMAPIRIANWSNSKSNVPGLTTNMKSMVVTVRLPLHTLHSVDVSHVSIHTRLSMSLTTTRNKFHCNNFRKARGRHGDEANLSLQTSYLYDY